jgi:hypothetical protein
MTTHWPRSEDEFAAALQEAADQRYVVILDPRTHVVLTRTIEVRQTNPDGSVWGVNGNYAKLDWKGPEGSDMVVFRGVDGMANRGLYVEKLQFYGGGYDGARCGSCLKLYAPDGDPGAIWRFTLRNITTAYGTHGIALIGGVFEGLGDNLHAENHSSHGILMEHTNEPGKAPGVVSNVMLVAPNCSRNHGAGIRSVNSCNMIFGSFVNNAEAGVSAPDGLRAAIACNGENTGESMFVVPYTGWGSDIFLNNAATNGSHHSANWDGSAWVPDGKPLLYLLDNAAKDVPQERNTIAYYGDGTNQDKVSLVKP